MPKQKRFLEITLIALATPVLQHLRDVLCGWPCHRKSADYIGISGVPGESSVVGTVRPCGR